MTAAAHASTSAAPPPPPSALISDSQPQSKSNTDNEEKKKKRKIVGFSERVEQSRARRESRPRSWVQRKLVIPFVFAIVIYSWYVYVGRFCVKMIRGDEDALGGVAEGVIFLVIFCFLGVMFWWSYIKLIFTPPGFAKDYVTPSPAPHQNPWLVNRRRRPSARRSGTDDGTESTWSSEDELGGSPYEELPQPRFSSNPSSEKEKSHDREGLEAGGKVEKSSVAYDEANSPTTKDRKLAPPPTSPKKLNKPRPHNISYSTPDWTQNHSTGNAADQIGPQKLLESKSFEVDENVRHAAQPPHISQSETLPQTQTLPPQSGGTVRTSRTTHTTGTHQTAHTSNTHETNNSSVPEEYLHRRPPQHPALLPEYRYCYKDNFVKPMRAHHCRICGTCVLRFDHHCPWIGQCVGAHNHKFFIIFTFWSSLWTLWTLASLVGLLAKNGDADTFDAQLIVLIAFAALFSLFTVLLCSSHMFLATINQTTVEQIGVMHMKSRERENLSILVPMCDWRPRDRHSNVHRRRNALRKEWDHEWGKLSTEGNMWWLGSSRENWEQVMGRNPWTWMLPLGLSLPDGLTYPINARFDAEGRWRRRSEWPIEFQ